MPLKAGRVGVHPSDVDPISGHISPSSTEGYTKSEADDKFETKTHASATFETQTHASATFETKEDASNLQPKTLAVPIEMLSGSKLDVESALQGLNSEKFTYADNGILGAKNLFNNTFVNDIINGVTFVKNADKTLTANGTATDEIKYGLSLGILPVGKYIISGCPSGGDDSSKYAIRIGKDSVSTTWGTFVVFDTGEGAEFEVTEPNTYYSINIRIFNGYTANNLIFKPMLRLASDSDSTYQPYAMTNRKITEELTLEESAITNIISGATAVDAENKLFRVGKIVFLDLALNTVTASAGEAIANIPTDYRPRNTTCIIGTSVNVGAINGYVQDGNIKFRESLSSATVRLHASWLTA